MATSQRSGPIGNDLHAVVNLGHAGLDPGPAIDGHAAFEAHPHAAQGTAGLVASVAAPQGQNAGRVQGGKHRVAAKGGHRPAVDADGNPLAAARPGAASQPFLANVAYGSEIFHDHILPGAGPAAAWPLKRAGLKSFKSMWG